MFRQEYVVGLCIAATVVACNRGYRGPDGSDLVDGGVDVRDAATPVGRRDGGTGGKTATEGRAGGIGGVPSAGAGGTRAGGAGAAGSAGAGEPDGGNREIDCAVDNGGCGDPVYMDCVTAMYGDNYCVDRDECVLGNNTCDPLTPCINVRGGPPTCGECPYGYMGSGEEGCTDIDECADNACGDPAYTQCVNEIGAYTCSDVPECTTDNGGCGDPAQFFCIEQQAAAPQCRMNECFVDNGGCGSPDVRAAPTHRMRPPCARPRSWHSTACRTSACCAPTTLRNAYPVRDGSPFLGPIPRS